MTTEFKLQNRVGKMDNLIPSSSIFYGSVRLFLCVVNGDEKTRFENPIVRKTKKIRTR